MTLFDPFSVSLDVVIRPCRGGDLPALEWFGLFAADRHLIRATFDRHKRGDAVMLVVEANGAVSGQAWVDLARRNVDRTGVIWAVRMLPCLQNLGIGSRLVAAAEAMLCERAFARAELTVERDNCGARRLYERLGYEIVDPAEAAPAPEALHLPRPVLRPGQWLFRKDLRLRPRRRTTMPALAHLKARR